MRSKRQRAKCLVFVAALATSAGNAAAAADRATLRAAGTLQLPAGVAVVVAVAAEAGDASERTRLLLPAIEDALHARGLAVSADRRAAWRLTVATTVTAEPEGEPFRIYGSIGSSSRPDVMVEMPLPQWPGRQQSAAYRTSVSMTLDRPGGPVIWQGAASAAVATADPLPIQARLATALIGRLGKTVAEASIPLD